MHVDMKFQWYKNLEPPSLEHIDAIVVIQQIFSNVFYRRNVEHRPHVNIRSFGIFLFHFRSSCD